MSFFHSFFFLGLFFFFLMKFVFLLFLWLTRTTHHKLTQMYIEPLSHYTEMSSLITLHPTVKIIFGSLMCAVHCSWILGNLKFGLTARGTRGKFDENFHANSLRRKKAKFKSFDDVIAKNLQKQSSLRHRPSHRSESTRILVRLSSLKLKMLRLELTVRAIKMPSA